MERHLIAGVVFSYAPEWNEKKIGELISSLALYII